MFVSSQRRTSRRRDSYEVYSYDTEEKKKSRLDLIRLSAVVCGIEFCYAAETAFVSPILLQIGLPIVFMSWTWCLPSIIGFFLVPILGSLSDKCSTRFGKRRPFIFLYSIGILIGLFLIAKGRRMGQFIGDPVYTTLNRTEGMNETEVIVPRHASSFSARKFGTTITVLGVFLLDLDCDACQSPSRAYLLDVTDPSQHSLGLTTFTAMAGLGGCLGYFLGGIPWENTFLAQLLGDHIDVLFTIVWFIYLICLVFTLTAAKEPNDTAVIVPNLSRSASLQYLVTSYSKSSMRSYTDDMPLSESFPRNRDEQARPMKNERLFYSSYLRSIIYMPPSLRWLCLTNFFCWMALVSYSLFFTDFVGQAVFGGDPRADRHHPLRTLYIEGVRFGSWGMSIYSISCTIYSSYIQSLNQYFGIKRVYIGSQLIYSCGMFLMGYFRHRVAVILLSAVSGILYSTLFTMPYLLISQYYASNTFGEVNLNGQVRGIGTDVAIVSSMVFLAQLCLSSTMGTLIYLTNSTVIVTVVASILGICGAISATQVLYLD